MVYFETEGKFEQVSDTVFITYTKINKWPGDPNAKPKINEPRFDTLIFKNQYEFGYGEYCLSKIYYDNNNIKEDKFFDPNVISEVSKISYETKRKAKKGDTTGAKFSRLKIPNSTPRGTWKYYNKKGELINQIEFDDSGNRIFQEEDTLEIVYLANSDFQKRDKKGNSELYFEKSWNTIKIPLKNIDKAYIETFNERVKSLKDTFQIIFKKQKQKEIKVSKSMKMGLYNLRPYLDTDTLYPKYDTLKIDLDFELISVVNQRIIEELSAIQLGLNEKDLSQKNIIKLAKRENIHLTNTDLEKATMTNFEKFISKHNQNGYSNIHQSHFKDVFSLRLKTKHKTIYLTQHYPSKANTEWELKEQLLSYCSININQHVFNLLPKNFKGRDFLSQSRIKEKTLTDFVYWLSE